jgi:hypothetical protein
MPGSLSAPTKRHCFGYGGRNAARSSQRSCPRRGIRGQVHAALEVFGRSGGGKAHAAAQHLVHCVPNRRALDHHRRREMGRNDDSGRSALVRIVGHERIELLGGIRDRILPDPRRYKAFEIAIIADYDAQSAVERELVLRLASLLWRIRRATTMETGLFEIQAKHLLKFQRTRFSELQASWRIACFPTMPDYTQIRSILLKILDGQNLGKIRIIVPPISRNAFCLSPTYSISR